MHDIEKGIPCSSSTDNSLYVVQTCVARLRDIICGIIPLLSNQLQWNTNPISISLEMITQQFQPFTRSLNHPVLPNGYSTLFALYISEKNKGFESQEIFIYNSL